MNIKGIYKITNIKSNKYYIGSDSNILKHTRWSDHKSKLRRNIHYNTHMQNAWNKYGEKMFKYEVLEKFEDKTAEELSDIEQKYLNNAKKDKKNCYNIIFGVRNYGRKSQPKLNRTREELLELQRARAKRWGSGH